MWFLTVVYIAITTLTINGQATTGASVAITQYNSQANCLAAQAQEQAKAVGNFRVFASCSAQ